MEDERGAAPATIAPRLVLVMAVATGLAIANNYYAQPLLPLISRSLHVSSALTGLIVTCAQCGYALGILLIVPLGDIVERRRLVVALAVLTAAALFCYGSAPNGPLLLASAFVVGVGSVLAQVLVPLAAAMASGETRGKVVGAVMSGLLLGILLARTVSGFLAETGSWRVVYFAAGAGMLVQALVLHRQLPEWREPRTLGYLAAVASVPRLLADEPVLRVRALFGLLSFGTFSVMWTSIAYLLSRHYHYSEAVIGLFGLAGAAGAAAASIAGRLSDRRLGWLTTLGANVLLFGSWGLIALGRTNVVALLVGIVTLDIGTQALHITNQGEIYRLDPAARSRITAAYIISYFIGGAAGSAASGAVFARAGWGGVCVVGAAFAGASLVLAVIVSPARLRHLGVVDASPAPVGAEAGGAR